MVIYEPLDFIGHSSFQVKGNAVYEMDQLVKGMLKQLKLDFKPYRFTTSREHDAQMKNGLARQFNEKKEKLQVKNEEGTTWLWIDNSTVEGYRPGELETNDAILSRGVQKHWNSHKKHEFKVDADYVIDNLKTAGDHIKQNADNLGFHAENMRSHVKAVQDLGDGVKELTRIIKELKNNEN